MKAMLKDAILAVLAIFDPLFRETRHQHNPIPVRIDDQRTHRHER